MNDELFSALRDKTTLITGATGLIGRNLVRALLEANCRVIAFVRNAEKAKRLFGTDENLRILVGDVTEPITVEEPVDYFIHGASQTASKAFVASPVDTIFTAIQGTTNLLNLAREKKASGFVYLSTMEVYGAPTTDEKIDETHSTNLDTTAVRSSYPGSKRLCELLCTSYWAQYGVPAKIVRLTQTFGPGVAYDDSRVFAEFARCAAAGRDIVLHTKGETKRSYLHTMDAVSAILTVLLKGSCGQAYNAANEATYCSIYEMAELVARTCSSRNISVVIDEDLDNSRGYAPVLRMNLDTGKLRALGWEPTYSLEEMFLSLCGQMKAGTGE